MDKQAAIREGLAKEKKERRKEVSDRIVAGASIIINHMRIIRMDGWITVIWRSRVAITS